MHCSISKPLSNHEEPTKRNKRYAFNGKISNSLTEEPQNTNVLLIPEFGVLRALYTLADAVIVGGGFGKATHNVLEATVQGKVAACGPNWQSIPENKSLVAEGLLHPAENHTHWTGYLQKALRGDFVQKEAQARNWVLAHSGACDTMIETLEQAVEL